MQVPTLEKTSSTALMKYLFNANLSCLLSFFLCFNIAHCPQKKETHPFLFLFGSTLGGFLISTCSLLFDAISFEARLVS